MQIVILQDGPYNDAQGNAKKLKAGAMFETVDWYANALIEAGLARASEPAPEPALVLEAPLEDAGKSAEDETLPTDESDPVDDEPTVIEPSEAPEPEAKPKAKSSRTRK